MQRISDAERRVRNLTNQAGIYERHFASRRDQWCLLTVAMDTLGDSAAALMHFETYGLGSNVDERYIRLYGMFQAIVLQQYAIIEIYKIYIGSKPTISKESGWKRCRELRNITTGHPLDAHGSDGQDRLRVFLSRIKITDNGFDLVICQEKEEELLTKRIDFRAPYNSYKEEALDLFRKIQSKQDELIAGL